MVDIAAPRRSALASASRRNVSLVPLPHVGRYIFRGWEAAITAAGPALGVTFPREACRAAVAGERAALWLGPDEWLLLCPEPDGPGLAGAIGKAAQGLPHSLVDVAHRQLAISVAGGAAARVLAAGCPLDLDEAAFPVGMCTRTVFGKAEIVLWRTAPDTFRLEVWRSFAAYVWQLLEQARLDWSA